MNFKTVIRKVDNSNLFYRLRFIILIISDNGHAIATICQLSVSEETNRHII
jgi:hypothetical protein